MTSIAVQHVCGVWTVSQFSRVRGVTHTLNVTGPCNCIRGVVIHTIICGRITQAYYIGSCLSPVLVLKHASMHDLERQFEGGNRHVLFMGPRQLVQVTLMTATPGFLCPARLQA
jgi:hypothetical protein